MKIIAQSLSEAYQIASKELGVSASEINIEIITKPSAGFFGFFKKMGEFEASANKNSQKAKVSKIKDFKKPKVEKKHLNDTEAKFYTEPKAHTELKTEQIKEAINQEVKPKQIEPRKPRIDAFKAYDGMIDSFNSPTQDNKQASKEEKRPLINSEVLAEVKKGLDTLFGVSDFKICVMEVSEFDENTIFVKLDGEDCALLIGKEGYRYKALSYLLYNWINSKYELNVRLEIAEFLKNQEVAVGLYLESVIAKIEEQGFGNTKVLDGVLLKIALEQLRAAFPQKYVGIKQNEEGKYIVVNDFHKR